MNDLATAGHSRERQRKEPPAFPCPLPVELIDDFNGHLGITQAEPEDLTREDSRDQCDVDIPEW